MSKPAGSDGSNLPDSTARPVAGSSEIITRLARDMRNASMFCEGPAVPWITARDIAEAAVHAAADAHNWRTVHKCPSCNRYFDSPSVCSDGTHTVEQEERVPSGAWPDQSAQHAVLLEQIKTVRAETVAEIVEALRERCPEVRAAISDSYYNARDAGRTMEDAADEAAAAVVGQTAVWIESRFGEEESDD